MALTLTTNAPNFPFHIIANDAAGKPGGSLPPQASAVHVTADKPDVGAISFDPNPTRIDNPFDPASGTPSIASGVVRPLAVGSATLTATVVGTDGAPLVTATDTLTVIEPAAGTPAWAGDLFAAALDIPATAPASHAAAAHSGNPEHRHGEEPKKHKA